LLVFPSRARARGWRADGCRRSCPPRRANGAPVRHVKGKELLVADLAGEPDKEVNTQVYTFPPGASVPWHIQPDAHEFDYELDGALTAKVRRW
jgi:quercetin dioxygenase-like cupin family protein